MIVKSVFDDIQKSIILQIRQAENEILICVPWLTDVEILNELILKLKEGLGVELLLLNDDSNRSKSEHYNKIVARGGKVFLVDKGIDGGIMHNKFCLIDRNVLINGSYNWSNNAKKNDENITISITEDDEDYILLNDFYIQYEKLLYKYGIKDEDEDWEEVITYTEEITQKQNEAGVYYELAKDYFNKNDLEAALEAINESIVLSPYPDQYICLMKHKILLKMKDFDQASDLLFLYLNEIPSNDKESKAIFKSYYLFFVNTIIAEGKNTYKLIGKLNSKTRSNLGYFSSLEIEPHFFTYEELDTLPF
jgi:tetratricopeptide (TPR) repeat protein